VTQAPIKWCNEDAFHSVGRDDPWPQNGLFDSGLKFRFVLRRLGFTFAFVKVNRLFAMKKINWVRVAFFFLMAGTMLLEACRAFKPKCDCPHF